MGCRRAALAAVLRAVSATSTAVARQTEAAGLRYLQTSGLTAGTQALGFGSIALRQLVTTVPAGLPFSARGVSSGAPSLQSAAEEQRPSSNPLQQASLASAQAAAANSTEDGEKRVAFCYKRGIKISPQKLNEAAKLVRKMHISDALINMEIREKKPAKLVKEALKSAFANAVNNHGMDADKLFVAECFVGKGRHLKRIRMHGMGKSAMMKKYRSHLTVKLEESETVEAKTKVVRPLLERPISVRKGRAQQ